MTHFTDSNFERIKNAINYTQATVESGCGLVRKLHIGRLYQSQNFLEQAHNLSEDMLEEIQSGDMFLAHVQLSHLLECVEGFLCLARQQEDDRDSDEHPEPVEWADVDESFIKACSYCFAKSYGILAWLKLVRESLNVT